MLNWRASYCVSYIYRPSNSSSRIVYKLQERTFGGLPGALRRKLEGETGEVPRHKRRIRGEDRSSQTESTEKAKTAENGANRPVALLAPPA